MPNPLPPRWETEELKAIIDAEVAGLPDRLRAVVVLCLIEGRTNSEAAADLGVPVGYRRFAAERGAQETSGSIDAPRRRGRQRVPRCNRCSAGRWRPPGKRLLDLVSQTIPAILTEVACPGAGALRPRLPNLARSTTMSAKLHFLADAGHRIRAPRRRRCWNLLRLGRGRPAANGCECLRFKTGTQQREESAADSEPKAETESGRIGDRRATQAVRDGGPWRKGRQFEKVLEIIETGNGPRSLASMWPRSSGSDESGLAERWIRRCIPEADLRHQSDPSAQGRTSCRSRDVLADALAQVWSESSPVTYQVRGSQIVIVPAYVPPFRPGARTPRTRSEQENRRPNR